MKARVVVVGVEKPLGTGGGTRSGAPRRAARRREDRSERSCSARYVARRLRIAFPQPPSVTRLVGRRLAPTTRSNVPEPSCDSDDVGRPMLSVAHRQSGLRRRARRGCRSSPPRRFPCCRDASRRGPPLPGRAGRGHRFRVSRPRRSPPRCRVAERRDHGADDLRFAERRRTTRG